MKRMLFVLLGVLSLALSSCKKDKEDAPAPTTAQLRIQIDYLGSGGYYNDNIDGVPTGLTLGGNGPFTIDAGQSYHLTYRASSNFPETEITGWSPVAGRRYVIHCYVSGNTEHIEAYAE